MVPGMETSQCSMLALGWGGALMRVGAGSGLEPVIGANFGVPPTPLPPMAIDPLGSYLVDDMTELTIEPKYDTRPYDEPFDPKDTLLLFMNQADRSSTSIASRILDLMPGNIDIAAAGTSQYLPEIGKRFTTTSWDLKQFALTSNPFGPDTKPGQANFDDNGDGVKDDLGEVGSSGSDDGPRAWEWNVDTDGNDKLEWPPQFNPSSGFRPMGGLDGAPGVAGADDDGNNTIDDETEYCWPGSDDLPQNAWGYQHNGGTNIKQDPFRPQLRRLLEAEFGNTSKARQPMRLSINEFLDVEHIPNALLPAPADPQSKYVGYFRNHPLHYRPLTPHSTDSAAADPAWGSPPALPTPFAAANVGNPLPQYPPRNEPEKEFWARRDRQQMARDIYVLLYTFCGDYSGDVTTTAGDTAYPVSGGYDLRRQMAQFAVNMVDALDRDNVITAFEYDRDLSNGWDLDDDVTTNDGGASDRAVVFGVEAQELTFSEAAWLRQETDTADNTQTPFNETLGEFNFLQFELRSTSAFDVSLAQASSTVANTGVWRVVRDDNGNGVFDSASENAFELLSGVGGLVAPGDKIPPGKLFAVASADSSPVGSAALYVDYSGGASDFELVAPNRGGIAPYVSGVPVVAADLAPDLDLLHAAHTARFALVNGSAGDFLSRTNNPGDGDTHLALQRRLNPDLPQLTIVANPYVTVDEFRDVQRRELRFQGGPMMMNPPPVASQADATNRLTMNGLWNTPELRSQERVQPLDAGNVQPCGTAGTGFGPLAQLNSIGQTNQNIPGGGVFNLFQPHFDRDFASTVDLFHVSLVAPRALTRNVRSGRQSPFTTSPVTFGQAVILQTEDQDGDGALGGSEDLNGNSVIDSNHYHRLLSMVEVPTRTHRQLGDPLKINRVPARINLNTIRDPRVLGALIDERDVMNPPEHTGADFSGNGVIDDGLQDRTGDAARDWWFDFLRSRDGVDPVSNLFLPGVLDVSRPFRDVGNLQSSVTGQSPIEDTLLRRLPAPTDTVGRRLFELVREDNNEFQNGAIEPVLRHRLLSKIYGNSTTRSNCFVVFVTIGMFECIQTTPAGATEPVVRIGGPLNLPSPPNPANTHETYRAVFIIDRSEAEQAFDPGGTTFDWRKLVMAKQRVN
jgi:hypothetical protein